MFEARLAACKAAVEAQLQREVAALPEGAEVRAAMAHALRGGKRLRAFLVIESARLHGVVEDRALWPAAGIEAVHAYSLVHDDLPAMDDDDLRRGEPTVHRKWDEATAILAGDALQSLGFELVLDPRGAEGAAARAALGLHLARAAGARGMVLGQAMDIAAESAAAPLTLPQIEALQAGKTGALIEWSAMAGARMAGADPAALGAYARALGLAFQIADDVLDVEGCADTVGKAVGKDARAGKATFVSLLGLDGAKTRARDLVTEACDALHPYGGEGDALRQAARFVISRES